MRLLLVTWLAVGLVPGLGEVAETVVHLATAGHLAHSQAAHCHASDHQDEHGCGATQHLCGCCASLSLDSPTAVRVRRPAAAAARRVTSVPSLASLHEPAPPVRPPIAS
jgi:hypothetical protein